LSERWVTTCIRVGLSRRKKRLLAEHHRPERGAKSFCS
jgi:hypothetical protein